MYNEFFLSKFKATLSSAYIIEQWVVRPLDKMYAKTPCGSEITKINTKKRGKVQKSGRASIT
jgi:hypothetical protein